MKLKTIIATLLLVGCSSTESPSPVISKTDSLIIESDNVAAKAEESSKILDSVTNVTSEKVHSNIKELNKTITNYENEIKAATKVKAVEKIIHDTVYIETKKSFWGRTKTSISKKSDSTVSESETVDTTQN